MKCNRVYPALFLTMTVLIGFGACSPSVIVTIKPDMSGKAAFNAEMTPTAQTVVRKFTGTNAAKSIESQLFNPESLKASLIQTGFSVDTIELPAKGGISLGLSFQKLDGLLAQAVSMKPGANSITVTLSRESINAAVDLMPSETREYLDLLMAPVFTGEELSTADFEDIIASTYGKTLAGDLKNARFTLTIRCPGAVKTAAVTAGGTADCTASKTGSGAVFTIPLTTLLSMENTVTASAAW